MDVASGVVVSVLVLSDAALLSLHLAATVAMLGLIWFVQIVHSRLFAAVGRSRSVSYEAAHCRGWSGRCPPVVVTLLVAS